MTIRGTNGYLGRHAFLSHLRTLPPGVLVGERSSFSRCPIAQEIKRIAPQTDYVSVGSSRISYHIPAEAFDHQRALPAWASAFIHSIDTAKPPYEPVTAAEAIAALERIK